MNEKGVVVRDHYAGFEGEPQMLVFCGIPSQARWIVRFWVGHFDHLMSWAKPLESGWAGLALPYHRHEGWYESPWQIPDLDTVIDQWRQIGKGELSDPASAVHADVLELMLHAREKGVPVWITYD